MTVHILCKCSSRLVSANSQTSVNIIKYPEAYLGSQLYLVKIFLREHAPRRPTEMPSTFVSSENGLTFFLDPCLLWVSRNKLPVLQQESIMSIYFCSSIFKVIES